MPPYCPKNLAHGEILRLGARHGLLRSPVREKVRSPQTVCNLLNRLPVAQRLGNPNTGGTARAKSPQRALVHRPSSPKTTLKHRPKTSPKTKSGAKKQQGKSYRRRRERPPRGAKERAKARFHQYVDDDVKEQGVTDECVADFPGVCDGPIDNRPKAYKRYALVYHPDKCKGAECVRKMVDLNNCNDACKPKNLKRKK